MVRSSLLRKRYYGNMPIQIYENFAAQKRTTAKHTARVGERRACSDAVKELSWDVS